MCAEKFDRKSNEQSFNEKLDNHNEKFTYAMQSFQSSVGNLTNSMNEQKEQVKILL